MENHLYRVTYKLSIRRQPDQRVITSRCAEMAEEQARQVVIADVVNWMDMRIDEVDPNCITILGVEEYRE